MCPGNVLRKRDVGEWYTQQDVTAHTRADIVKRYEQPLVDW